MYYFVKILFVGNMLEGGEFTYYEYFTSEESMKQFIESFHTTLRHEIMYSGSAEIINGKITPVE